MDKYNTMLFWHLVEYRLPSRSKVLCPERWRGGGGAWAVVDFCRFNWLAFAFQEWSLLQWLSWRPSEWHSPVTQSV